VLQHLYVSLARALQRPFNRKREVTRGKGKMMKEIKSIEIYEVRFKNGKCRKVQANNKEEALKKVGDKKVVYCKSVNGSCIGCRGGIHCNRPISPCYTYFCGMYPGTGPQ
jgi:hypothetical protein